MAVLAVAATTASPAFADDELSYALPPTAVNNGDIAAADGVASSGEGSAFGTAPVFAGDVLADAEAALAGEGEPSAALNDVVALLPDLSGAQRARGEQMLARPTQGGADPGDLGYNRPAVAVFSRHFCVFFVRSGPDAPSPRDTDADTIPDYIEAAANFAEISYTKEHGALGFRKPVSDGNLGCNGGDGRSRTDLYIKDLNGNYGVAIGDPNQGNRRSIHAYFVVDEDFVEQGYGSHPLDALSVSIAHEYNHILHDAYDVIQDGWMFETTATWVEEQVFPGVNDYVGYLPALQDVESALTDFNGGGGIKIYGDAVWNHFLSRKLGVLVVRDAWASSFKTRPQDFAPGAYSRGIAGRTNGRSDFFEQFAAFAASLAEWRATNLYPDHARYPDIRRTGSLTYPEQFFDRFRLDHTTYRLVAVRAPNGRAARLEVRAPRGVDSALALVGLKANNVVTRLKLLPNGGIGKITLPRPGGFSRITAVIVNADSAQRGFSGRTGDWIWTNDREIYDAAIFKVG